MDRLSMWGLIIPVVLIGLALTHHVAVAETAPRDRAAKTLNALIHRFWNEHMLMFNTTDPCSSCNTTFHYWWQAHALDALLDGYELTGDVKYIDYVQKLHTGVKRRNGGHLFNDYYDDMLWMALALLRAYNLTGTDQYLTDAQRLWSDIQGGWNDHYGGGIAWRKSQRDYKNAPSNGPAVILAARLYVVTGDDQYLTWAKKVYEWLDTNLVDPRTHLVWDGINRQGDGNIDKGWLFTYNQGTYIGANVALWHITGDSTYIQKAQHTATAATLYVSDGQGVLQDEGQGDGGLFKGIFIRYAVELVRADSSQTALLQTVMRNADSAWDARTSTDTFGPRWKTPQHPGKIDLSTHLSGVMLMALTAQIAETMADPQYPSSPDEVAQ